MWKICGLHFFCFRPEKLFLDKPGQKIKTVKAEIWYQETNLNMQNSTMILTFSVFDWKYLFVQFDPKNKNCQFVLNFRTGLI